MSLPISREVKPIASDAADPPDEPPQVRSGLNGFSVVPYTSLYDWISPAQIGKLVFPQITAPASRTRATGSASSEGTKSASSGAPEVVMQPSVWNESLTVIGTPCNGPRG